MKRNVGTKTMKQIARNHPPIERVRNSRFGKKKNIQKEKKGKKEKLVQKKVIASNVKSKSGALNINKKKIKAVKASKLRTGISSIPLAAPSVAVSSVAPVARTGSRASNTGKIAQLSKSKSKDAQIPAFGFIDVCFCVDSTGSMSS